jgi:hypothetical protein
MRSQSVASIAPSVASSRAQSIASIAPSIASSRAQSVAASLHSDASIQSTLTELTHAVGSIDSITARITPIVRSNSMDAAPAAPAAPAVDLLTVMLANNTAARDELNEYIATPTIVLADEGGAEIIINSGLVALEALAGAAQQSEGVVNILIAQAPVLPNEELTQHDDGRLMLNDDEFTGGKTRKTSKKQAYKSKYYKKQTFKNRTHKK